MVDLFYYYRRYFMFYSVISAVASGIKVQLVRVEADVVSGLPGLHLVGYLSSEVRESA